MVDESSFEGTIVLERLARIDRVEEFMAAVDSENSEKATELMKVAGIDDNTIAIVLKKMQDPYDEP